MLCRNTYDISCPRSSSKTGLSIRAIPALVFFFPIVSAS